MHNAELLSVKAGVHKSDQWWGSAHEMRERKIKQVENKRNKKEI